MDKRAIKRAYKEARPPMGVYRVHNRVADRSLVGSSTDGNGVRVNGERLARAQLADGDIIELGRTRLKFESVPV